MDQAEYLEARVDAEIKYYERAANKMRKTHLRIQTSVIVGALLVPVLVNAPELIPDLSVPIRLSVTIVSLLVAILNGLANLGKPGELWLTYRMTQEHLKHEKFLFLTGSGKYVDADNQFSVFVESSPRSALDRLVRPAGLKYRIDHRPQGPPPRRAFRRATHEVDQRVLPRTGA